MRALPLKLGVFSLLLASCAQLSQPDTGPALFAKLSGNNVKPAVSTGGWGYANATWNGSDLVIKGNYFQLSSPVTGMALLQAKVGQNTVLDPICTFTVSGDKPEVTASQTAGSGTFSKTCTVKDHKIQEDLLKTGQYYLLVKTQNQPDGELRGQLGYE